MKKIAVALCFAMVAFTMGAQASDCKADVLVEQVMLLQLVEEAGLSEWSMVEVLQGYAEYRDIMDELKARRADKRAELEAAIAADEGAARLATLTRELMDIDMNILRTLQASVNEASGVVGAKATAQMYLVASDMDTAKAKLIAQLTGAPAAGVCPMAAGVCPLAAAACPVDEAPALTEEWALEQITQFLGKLGEGDLDGAMAGVAEDFEHFQYRTKEELRDFLDDAIFIGYLDNIEINTDDAEVEIDGNKIVAYPVDILGNFGTVTLELIGEMRDGKLMLVSMDAFGM